MAEIVPGSARIRTATINGEDISTLIRNYKDWRSIFKPFGVAEIVLYDNKNFINKSKLKGNEDFQISYDSGQSGGNMIRSKYKVVSVTGVNDFPSARVQAYKIRLADEMYFRNQTVRVQQAYSKLTGTDMIKKLYETYLKGGGTGKLNILKESKGLIGTDSAKFIRSNEYPLASISSILKYLYANESGNFIFYQDEQNNWNVGPLEYIVEQAQQNIMGTFTRDPTVGKNAGDFEKIKNNIIGLFIPEKSSPASPFQNTKQVRKPTTFAGERHDAKTPKNVEPGKVIGQPQNSEGDEYQTNFERRVTPVMVDKKLHKNHPYWETADKRQLYASILQNGPRYTMTVTGDTGINVMVGKGINADIPAPIGDQNPTSQNQIKGNSVVANSMRELKPYDTRPQFTCTFDCFRGGVNKT